MSEQINTLETEVVRDLKKDFQGDNDDHLQTNSGENAPQADFLPRELVSLFVLGKNGLVVSYLSKDISENAAVLIKDAYKPTDREIDIYRINIQKYIRDKMPQVANWFQTNSNPALAELMAFEMVRVVPLMEVLRQGKKQKEKQDNKKGEQE